MGDIAIRVEGLSKQYRIGRKSQAHTSLRDVLTDAIAAPFHRARSLMQGQAYGATGSDEIIWALKDVSFEVKRGEVIGIVGRNGAGKSTLLKILSRITAPTEGRVKVYGRIGALLEVGTGFHAELTGRENIYLNGAILGMSRAEIDRKFDEIVAFSEVEKFIDTPVKRYSSGMGLRLGFAVAAHLEPEILIVDEVLAVGDVRFQKRCLDKMDDIGRTGRTVFYVSHNMASITRLCTRALLFKEGCLCEDGLADFTVYKYLTSDRQTSSAREWNPQNAPQNNIVMLHAVYARKVSGEISESFETTEPVNIEIHYSVRECIYSIVPVIRIINENGIILFTDVDKQVDLHVKARPVGRYVTTLTIPGSLLAEGLVTVTLTINTFSPVIIHVAESDVIAFQIVENIDKSSARKIYGGTLLGVIRPATNWLTRRIE